MPGPKIVLTDDNLTIIFDDEIYTVDRYHDKWDDVVSAVEKENWTFIRTLLNIPNNRWHIIELD